VTVTYQLVIERLAKSRHVSACADCDSDRVFTDVIQSSPLAVYPFTHGAEHPHHSDTESPQHPDAR
jgi:hypothetical protein